MISSARIKRRIAAFGLCLAVGSGLVVPASADMLRFYNWTDYTSPKLVQKFEHETGIKVIVETYTSNEELLETLRSGDAEYDLAVPSQHFLEIMIREGLLRKIDARNMPNFGNVSREWRNPDWDAERAYSVPWHWGTTSFAYRRDLYPGQGTSLKELFEPHPDAKNRVLVLDAPDEVINLAHLFLGSRFCSEDANEMKRVEALLRQQRPSVRVYASDNIKTRLVTGDVSLAIIWNGEALRARQKGAPHLTYAYPKEGVLGWLDSLVIPAKARNVAAARAFMNFVMAPENMAIQSAYSKYRTMIVGGDNLIADDLRDAPELNPPTGTRIMFPRSCSPRAQALIRSVWEAVHR